jgi:hypothetical protein
MSRRGRLAPTPGQQTIKLVGSPRQEPSRGTLIRVAVVIVVVVECEWKFTTLRCAVVVVMVVVAVVPCLRNACGAAIYYARETWFKVRLRKGKAAGARVVRGRLERGRDAVEILADAGIVAHFGCGVCRSAGFERYSPYIVCRLCVGGPGD